MCESRIRLSRRPGLATLRSKWTMHGYCVLYWSTKKMGQEQDELCGPGLYLTLQERQSVKIDVLF